MSAGRLELGRIPLGPSLREVALSSLRTELISGGMVPGELYSAADLASKLNISTTPVREALLDLTREGVLSPVRNRGFRVTLFSADQLELLCELRAMLEVPILGRVAESMTLDDLERLRSLADHARTCVENDLRPEFVQADLEFHLNLTELAGNPYIVSVVEDFRNRSKLSILHESYTKDRLMSIVDEHYELLVLIETNALEEAKALLTRHIYGR